MDEDREKSLEELAAELSEEAKELGKTTGKVALSAVLATSLSAALQQPPNTDLMELPEPTPIVRVLEEEKEAVPPVDEVDEDDLDARRQRFRKMLKYLLIALLIVASLLFGALKGCTACTAGVLLPKDDPAQEQADEDGEHGDEAAAAAFAKRFETYARSV